MASARPYHDWPYATSYLQHTLDPTVIEAHARLIVARGLNLSRLVAFVGAGASMSYGRISWEDLVNEEVDYVLKKAKAPSPAPKKPEIALLTRQLEDLRDPKNMQTDKYTTIYQVAEQLDEALGNTPQENSKTRTSKLVINDRGHAVLILERGVKHIQHDGVTEILDELRRDTDASDFRKYFTHGKLADLAKIVPQPHRDLAQLLATVPMPKEPEDPLHAAQRHRIGALLRLIPETLYGVNADLTAWWEFPVPGKARRAAGAPAKRFKRDDFVPKMRDPLAILEDYLRIRRFVTTNYDSEIERLFKDRKYQADSRASVTDAPQGSSQLRPVFTAAAFKPTDAGDLLAFAARDRYPAGVVHLHGRAVEEGSDPLVITEADYQKLYLGEEHRVQVADALNVTFGGNPILFIGSGMSEDDILRPLRQFMSAAAGIGDRMAVALLPGFYDGPERIAEKIDLLNRYGVYTIHFGVAQFARPNGKPVEVHWLAWINRIRKALLKIFKEWGERSRNSDALELARTELKDCLESGPLRVDGKPEKSICYANSALIKPLNAEGINIDRVDLTRGERCFTAEVDLLNAAIIGALGSIPRDARKRTARAEAYKTLTAGAFESITTAFLCASLLRLRDNWTEWKRNWFEIPEARPALGAGYRIHLNAGPPAGSVFAPRAQVYRRHIPRVGAQPSADQRFYADAASQTFLALLGALGNEDTDGLSEFKDIIRRRTLLLLGERGAGKGHFFIAMAGVPNANGYDGKNLEQFLKALRGGRSLQTWEHLIFFNLSFSREVMSAFDRISQILHTAAKIPGEISADLRTNRVAHLRAALDKLKDRPSATARVLIMIQSSDVLFDQDGRAKNSQVEALLSALFDEAYENAPIDILFDCQDDHVPARFRRSAKTQVLEAGAIRPRAERVLHLSRKSGSAHGKVDDIRRLMMALDLSKEPRFIADEQTQQGDEADSTAIYMLRPARGSVMGATYFPEASLAIALDILNGPNGRVYERDSTHWEMREAIAEEFGVPNVANLAKANVVLPAAIGLFAHALMEDDNPPPELFRQILARLCAIGADWPKSTLASLIKDFERSGSPFVVDVSTALRVAEGFDDQMRQIHQSVDGGRFALTLLLSGAEAAGRLGSRHKKFNSDQVGNVRRYLDRLDIQLTGAPSETKADTVVENLRRMVENRIDKEYRNGGDLIAEILWHLAIVGQPVEAAVLARCPRIRTACQRVEGLGPCPDDKIPERLSEFLEEAVKRCLIFQMGPSHRELKRYAVHRLIQKNIFQKLGAPHVEVTDPERFTLSLYAAQPDGLPKLKPAAHRQILECFDTLCGYPVDYVNAVEAAAPAKRGEADRPWRSEQLRAAAGIIRSIYSVAVLARFESGPAHQRDLIDEEGYFEALRRRIRWLLKVAVDLSRKHRKGSSGLDALPFYAEEIVWLYNECGLLSLVQGRLNDAEALFTVALAAAHRIEPDRQGVLHQRLYLNKALSDIERGHAAEAASTLKWISEAAGDDPVVANIALGYRGLIAHLEGNYEAAHELYQQALTGLQERKSTRALSIFKRHHAALLTAMGPPNDAAAEAASAAAIHFAQMGGHEDVRHMAVLNHARLRIFRGTRDGLERAPGEGEGEGTLPGSALHRELDLVENYARLVGMPRLICEVHQGRAQLLIAQGEMRLAGSLAAKSVEIASSNNMRLRKTSGMLQLALLNRHTEPENLRPILTTATQMAKSNNMFGSLALANRLAGRYLTKTPIVPAPTRR